MKNQIKIINKAIKLNSFNSQNFCAKNYQQKQKQEELKHTHDITDDFYESYRKEIFQSLYKSGLNNENKIKGFATKEGTLKYSQRKSDLVDPLHFNTPMREDLKLSSVGIGTYTGAPEQVDDLKMFNAICDSVLTGGVNVIDTAINYRYMKSERSVGAAVRHLVENLEYGRDELFIASKGGYIIDDADNGIPGSVQLEQLIKEAGVPKEEIITDLHSMHPKFLDYMIQKSLNNIGVETLDLYYLHNSAEQQMSLIGEEKYYDKLKKSFEFLQEQIDIKKTIKAYGMATWLCFRSPKSEEKIHTSLHKVTEIAKQIGGQNHGFKYIQVPINVMMPEAFCEKWQETSEDPSSETYEPEVFLLRAARQNQVNVISSSPLMQGAMLNVPLPSDVFKCKNLGAKHLQFMRSIPSPALISTLIGQKTNRHTKMNLEVIQYPPLEVEEFWEFMTPKERQQFPEETIDLD
ncbi:NADP-dependent oxidoreductase domain [Pseudocohnilembus persalinus]|uniref:NADP-dependent oxidoreductase domain n=1 Tax=Pseudocohnilembus persalinus TaxID=266149 RepID=A0A0V0R864_PSEPJ|nr:NADP-dependent oxidoreductase domain [Pseudocohnilembus persalinus]|eukprot:KRX10506.1 NADP-dependent oxidoreductase domain [Pseudocohnilembus persalinus]